MASPSQTTSSSSLTVSKNCLSPSGLNNSVVVSNNLLQLIRDIPSQNDTETSPDSTFAHLSMDELLMHLKNYIIKHNLYDQKNPSRILLKENALGLLLGKSEFSLLEVRDILFEKLVCLVNENSSEVISHSTRTINDKMSVSKKRKLDYIYNGPEFSAKKRNTSFVDTSYDSDESMHSCQEYETEFVKDSDADSLKDGVIDGLIIAETYDVEYEIQTPEGDELSCESEGELEDMVKSAIINFIARSSDSDIEYLADESSGDESNTEKEISEEDKWLCFSCDTINDPLMRHCAACWNDRVGWLSERSVCVEVNMGDDPPHTKKESERNFVDNPRKEKISVRKGKKKLSSKKSSKNKDLSNRKLCSSGESSLSSSSSSSHTNDHDVQTPSTPPMQEADKDHIPKVAELDKALCLFCCAKPADSTIIHGHWGCQVSCFECGRKLMKGKTHGAGQKRCPVCRRFIEKIVYCFN